MTGPTIPERVVAVVALYSFTLTTLAPSLAWAQERPEVPARSRVVDEVSSKDLEGSQAKQEVKAEAADRAAIAERSKPEKEDLQKAVGGKVEQTQATKDAPVASGEQVAALPTGNDKSGVTSQSISVPKGAGTIQGMGESFSSDPSTGIATFSVPFSLPAARGGAQPSLGLSYSSASGAGLAGMGWGVGVPYIARQTDRGLPSYNEGSDWQANQDRFVFNDGQELVPICKVQAGASCTGALPGESFPAWSVGYQYFRPRVEGSFQRFFWSENHRHWIVQDKSGITMELGAPLDQATDDAALELNPNNSAQIFRWHLVRQYDTYRQSGKPVNVVVYKYGEQDGGQAYLTDIYDTTSVSAPTDTTALGSFAHHTHLHYEARTDPTESYRSGWLIKQTKRLKRVDVTSKTESGGGERRVVRRYHLDYDGGFHTSYLTSVQVEGRCVSDETQAQAEEDGLVGFSSCPKLPPMTFAYSHVDGFTTDGTAVGSSLTGYEAFDARLQAVGNTPPHSIDDNLADFFDINADGLPDVLVTAPGTYSDYGVFFNAQNGISNSFGSATQMSVHGVLGANAASIQLSNPHVTPLDADGDGAVDFVRMPSINDYSVYRPRLVSGQWILDGEAIDVSGNLNPKINLGNSTTASETNIADVNFDGLVDVVITTGTEVQSYLSLGRLPGGKMLFGKGSLVSSSTASLSSDPIAKCVPFSGTSVKFSDPEIKLADMNGDGIQDIVRARRGVNAFLYWPGRGNGFWGTGLLDNCPAGTFGSNRAVTMQTSADFANLDGVSLRMDDVNGDGFDDIVQVKTNSVDVWLNVDGHSWTQRHIINGTPNSPDYANRVRLMDINGSGTRDITWGTAGAGGYKYMDLAGGERPGVLIRVENGLGKSTDIAYTSSTEEMLAAERSGATCTSSTSFERAWCTKMPMVAHMVKRVTESDNLSVAGSGEGRYITEYSYRDPVYEGRQREFRGFRQTRAKRLGDANSPTDFTESTFLLGECESEGSSSCDISGDNPKEALKGLPVINERFDEQGKYLSTQATTYRLRHLYTGRDGRAVRHAFASGQRSILYDTAAATAGQGSLGVAAVELEGSAPTSPPELPAPNDSWKCELRGGTFPTPPSSESFPVPLRASTGYAVKASASYVDPFGNAIMAIDRGCIQGSACPAASEGLQAEEAICGYTVPGRPAGDASGWLYRTADAWSRGSLQAQVRKQSHTDYSPEGAPTVVSATFGGEVALDRWNSYSVAWGSAAAPLTASSAGARVVSRSSYDLFGNGTKVTGADGNAPGIDPPQDSPLALGRCRTVTFDDAYRQLPVAETIFSSGCDKGGITTTAGYDRAFGLTTSVEDPNANETLVKYDGFGRLVQLFKPRLSTSAPQPGGPQPQPALPSVQVDYSLPSPTDPRAYSVIHTAAQSGSDETKNEYLETYSFVDGMGRARVGLSQADQQEDGAAWIVSSIAEFDAKGAVRRKYLPSFLISYTSGFPVGGTPPETQYGRQRYDAFGRQVQTFDVDGTVTLQSRYHALSTDLWDAADLYPGPHQGTYATTTADGHGRTIETTQRFHETSGSGLATAFVRTKYLPTGEPTVITRARDGYPSVMRWMRYDWQGRMVLNVDPHTSNFTDDVDVDATPVANAGLKAWRYAYNDAGDLVGTSDARGCGQNFFYDGAGRLYGEDYSPCIKAHGVYSAPVFSGKQYDTTALTATAWNGLEVFYQFDGTPTAPVASPAQSDGFTSAMSLNLVGKLAAVHDRGASTWFTYDARGRGIFTFRKIALEDTSPGHLTIPNRYVNNWYKKKFTYDEADRPVEETTGISSSALKSSDPNDPSAVRTIYSKRGTIQRVDSSYGPLVKSIKRSADGLVQSMSLGDTAETTTAMRYDTRRRLSSVQTYRQEANLWSTTGSGINPDPTTTDATRQLLLQDLDYSYDIVGNPTEIRDWRIPEEWPDGAKPVSRRMEYDDLYRVTRVDYEYPRGSDKFVSPFASEVAGGTDPRRATPRSHKLVSKRPLWHTYKYDWLGNTVKTDDDQHVFWDRSIGTITHNTPATGTKRPYQFYGAAQTQAPYNGQITADVNGVQYDATGNIIYMRVLSSTQTNCTSTLAVCGSRFWYTWDEVGRLITARRTEGEGPNATGPTLDYVYDANDQRIIKRSYTQVAGGALTPTAHTLYVFNSLEIRRASFNTVSKQYAIDSTTEVGYLIANGMHIARLHYELDTTGEPRLETPNSIHSPGLHILLQFPDHLGSTSFIIDQDTSELVEARTYQPYGATESDYRPERWKGFREDYGFTGKEEDVEVGLQYFGKRFLSPYCGRWISPDPLAMHGPGQADLNLYAYVHGSVLKATDPLGLTDPRLTQAQKEFADASRTHEQFVADAKDLQQALKGDYAQAVTDQQKFSSCELTGQCIEAAFAARQRTEAAWNKLYDLRSKIVEEAKAYGELKERFALATKYYQDISIENLDGKYYQGPADKYFSIQKAGYDAVVDNIQNSGIFAVPISSYAALRLMVGEKTDYQGLAEQFKIGAAVNKSLEAAAEHMNQLKEARAASVEDHSTRVHGGRVPGTTPRGEKPANPFSVGKDMPLEKRLKEQRDAARVFSDWFSQK